MSHLADMLAVAQRERRFRTVVHAALGAMDDIASVLATTDGVLVTTTEGERFLVLVVSQTGKGAA